MMLGAKYGRWTVIADPEPGPHRKKRVLCRCRCGTEKLVQLSSLENGLSRSCGCLSVELTRKRFTSHGARIGQRWSKEYRAWNDMKSRCLNPNVIGYKNYGGRAITICERWKNSFAAFSSDMGRAPKGASLDRRDNDKGYFPDNCRWGTAKEQTRNRRRTLSVSAFGEKKSLGEWIEDRRTVVPYETAYSRIFRLRWGAERALTTRTEKHLRRNNG